MTHPHARRLSIAVVAIAVGLLGASSVMAHPHEVRTGNDEIVVIANGQNHPGFVYNEATGQYESCEGVSETGPAGYGLETAHHGPDQGTPGKADGCFDLDGPAPPASQDRNPAID